MPDATGMRYTAEERHRLLAKHVKELQDRPDTGAVLAGALSERCRRLEKRVDALTTLVQELLREGGGKG